MERRSLYPQRTDSGLQEQGKELLVQKVAICTKEGRRTDGTAVWMTVCSTRSTVNPALPSLPGTWVGFPGCPWGEGGVLLNCAALQWLSWGDRLAHYFLLLAPAGLGSYHGWRQNINITPIKALVCHWLWASQASLQCGYSYSNFPGRGNGGSGRSWLLEMSKLAGGRTFALLRPLWSHECSACVHFWAQVHQQGLSSAAPS